MSAEFDIKVTCVGSAQVVGRDVRLYEVEVKGWRRNGFVPDKVERIVRALYDGPGKDFTFYNVAKERLEEFGNTVFTWQFRVETPSAGY